MTSNDQDAKALDLCGECGPNTPYVITDERDNFRWVSDAEVDLLRRAVPSPLIHMCNEGCFVKWNAKSVYHFAPDVSWAGIDAVLRQVRKSSYGTPELLPWPFCGSNDVSLSTGYQGEMTVENARRYVECDKCAATSDFGMTDHEAAAEWNRRSQPNHLRIAIGHADDLRAIAELFGIEYEHDIDSYWVPAEPGPVQCDSLIDALKAWRRIYEARDTQS